MKIVISDDLPVSAADLLREVTGWTVDARAGRPLPELEAALADADALVVRSATKVTRALDQGARRAFASSRGRAAASTTWISRPQATAASW